MRIERIKEEIAELRIWRNYAITVIIALIAFVATQYRVAELGVLCLSGFVILCLFVAMLYLNRAIIKKLKEFDKV